MAQEVKYVIRRTTCIVVQCDCGKEFRILGDFDEEQSELGSVKIEFNCEFCGCDFYQVIDLEDFD